MNNRHKRLFFLIVICIGVILSACSGGDNNEPNKANVNNQSNENNFSDEINDATSEPEEVTIQVGGGLWNDVLSDFVEEEFPHVTIEYIDVDLGWPVDQDLIQEYISAGNFPDLINFGNPADIPAFAEFELLMPLDERLEKSGYDLSRLQPGLIPTIQSYAPNEEIYAMPVDLATWVVAYNKDIFDLFGVEYPEDHMTWDEMIDLAHELTREHEGIQYRGLHPGPHHQLLQQTGFTYVDPETNKPLYEDSVEVQKALEIYEKIINIPGNMPDEDPFEYFLDFGHFAGGERNVAMQPQWNSVVWQIGLEEEVGLNWDQVTWPTLGEGFEQTGPIADGQMVGISPHSEHVDLAFEILSYLISDEFQAIYARDQAKAPIIDDQEIIAEIGKNEVVASSPKNLEALTSLPYKVIDEKRSIYQQYAEEAFLDGLQLMIEDGIDINSALRHMQEKAEAAIAEAEIHVE